VPLQSVYETLAFADAPVLRALRALAAAPPSIDADTRGALLPLVLVLFLFDMHLVRRLYESVFVAAYSTHSQQHLLVTVVGQ
jgi:hypothetical protein